MSSSFKHGKRSNRGQTHVMVKVSSAVPGDVLHDATLIIGVEMIDVDRRRITFSDGFQGNWFDCDELVMMVKNA